jgi:tetratricopeptide (TPR) repeat protein
VTRKSSFACLLGIFFASLSLSQTAQRPVPNSGAQGTVQQDRQQPPEENLPPEEDEAEKPRVYPLDPLEAERNIKVGTFYMHRGRGNDYHAAAGRFEDATKYNPKSAEAYFKLGEVEEKLKNKDRARAAFTKVTQIAPDTKLGKEAKKKLAHI